MSHPFDQDRTRILELSDCDALRAILCKDKEETALRLLAAYRLGSLGTAGREALQIAYTAAAEDPPGRIAALKVLVTVFLPDAKPTLLDALSDAWPRVRRSARLLLKAVFEELDEDFRLRCYLPEHLRTNASALAGDWTALGRDDQIAVLNAIGKARFTPVLPQIVAELHRQEQIPISDTARSEWPDNMSVRFALRFAVEEFGNQVIPYLIQAITETSQDRYSLFRTLAVIDTPESWDALTPFQSTHAVRHLMEQREKIIRSRRAAAKPRAKAPTNASSLFPAPLATVFKVHANLLFHHDRERVRTAIEYLQRDQRDGAFVLLSRLANDPTRRRLFRQWAHNGMEVWRRYNDS
jgi:hypothetical protein